MGSVIIRGDGTGGLNISATTCTVASATTVTLPYTNFVKAFPNQVDYLNPLTINWKYTGGDSTFYDAGASENPVYITLTNPATANMYRTVVHLACSNPGATTSNAAVANSWSVFPGLQVKRVDGTQLVYWGAYAAQDPPPADAFTVAGLLKNADGRCGAWARFLLEVYGVNGSSASVQAITTKNLPGGTNGVGFLVKNWDLTTSPPTDLSGVAAQGNLNPQSSFSDHTVVLEGTTIYDPSYGKDYANLTAWEDSSLDALIYTAAGVTFWLPNTLGDQQTQMNPSP